MLKETKAHIISVLPVLLVALVVVAGLLWFVDRARSQKSPQPTPNLLEGRP